MGDFAARREKLRRCFKQQSIDALLVTRFTNVTYLTGFTGDDSYLLVTREGETLLTDFRYVTQLAEECPGLELVVRKQGQQMTEAIVKAVKAARVGGLSIEAD